MIFSRNKSKLDFEAAQNLYYLFFGQDGLTPDHYAEYAGKLPIDAVTLHIRSQKFKRQTVNPLLQVKPLPQERLSPEQMQAIAATLKRFFNYRGKGSKSKSPTPVALLLFILERRLISPVLADHFSPESAKQILTTLKDRMVQTNRAIEFNLDFVSGMTLHGFTYDKENLSRQINLGFFINGNLISTGQPELFRRDIQDRVGGNGKYGFHHELVLPIHLNRGAPVNLSIRDMHSGIILLDNYKILTTVADQLGYARKISKSLETLAEKFPDGPNDLDDLKALLNQTRLALPKFDRIMVIPLTSYCDLDNKISRSVPAMTKNTGKLHIFFLPGSTRIKDLPETVVGHILSDFRTVELTKALSTVPENDLIYLFWPGDHIFFERINWLLQAATTMPDKNVFLMDFQEKNMPVLHGIFDPDFLLSANPYRHAFATRAKTLRDNLADFYHNMDILTADQWATKQLIHLLYQGGEQVFHTLQKVLIKLDAVIRLKQIDKIDPVKRPDFEWVRSYFEASGLIASVRPAGDVFAPDAGGARSIQILTKSTDKLSVIIPTRNMMDMTRTCFDSLYETAGSPDLLDIIIVDNQSDDPEALAWFEDIQAQKRARVIRHNKPFNWSEINNEAVKHAVSDKLLFLNNDTVALSSDWDNITRGDLDRPEIGAVGARLLYADNTIQHAGIVLFDVGVATHDGIGDWPSDGGYYGRSLARHSVAGVTGAYLATRRDIFNKVGGFDAENLKITFNDVDFCLKILSLGKRILYLPEITFSHLESKSRGFDYADPAKRARAIEEKEWMEQKWKETLSNDPYYPPLFRREGRPFHFLNGNSSYW